MELFLCIVAILATTIGAISGMGGGIIIKPVMDAVSGMEVAQINFMSASTVLAMALVSIYRGKNDTISTHYPTSIALALGACLGGFLGRYAFGLIPENPALIQSILLFCLNVAIYFYVKFKSKIKTLEVRHYGVSTLIGCGLGTIASFLGIGGGPINIAVLSYFFSSSPKSAAKSSIFIILISQITSLTIIFATGVPPNVNYIALFLMILGGCSGAILGGKVSKKCSEAQIHSFFNDVLVLVIVLNAYNMGVLSR